MQELICSASNTKRKDISAHGHLEKVTLHVAVISQKSQTRKAKTTSFGDEYNHNGKLQINVIIIITLALVFLLTKRV